MPVDSSIYGNLQSGGGLGKLGPADILNLANEANKLSLFPLQKQRQEIENATAQFGLQAGQNQFLRDGLGALAGKGDALTKKDVNDFIVAATRNTNIPTSTLSTYLDGVPDDPKQLLSHIRNLQNIAIGSAGTATRVQGPPGPQGEQTTAPLGQVNYGGSAMPVGLPPGSDVSAGAHQSDLINAGRFKDDIFPLMKARELAEKLGPGGMAPGSKGRQDLESYIYGLMPQLVPAGRQDKIKNYAELEKYLVNNTMQRAQGLGLHTDAGRDQAVTGSPNVHINDLAGKELIDAQIALRRMEHAVTLQAAKAGPAKYTAEKGRIAAEQDPRAYRLDLMKPEEVKNLDATLKGRARDRFNASLKAGIDSGAIVLPERGNARAEPPPKPPIPGVELGKDASGNPAWFIRDGAGKGKHLQVKMPDIGG